MKMRISADQLQQLTPEQQEKLRELWTPESHNVVLYDGEEISIYDCYLGKEKLILASMDFYHEHEEVLRKDCLPLLSIGQCIEILRERNIDALAQEFWQLAYGIEGNYFDVVDELLDAFWQAVKSIL